MNRVKEIWDKMNDRERFECKFSLFPYWVFKQCKPTNEEIVELMKISEHEKGVLHKKGK